MRSKNAIRNIATSLLLQIIAIVYGFIVPKIIIDCFGSNVNGLVVSITQFLSYISLLESGFGPVVKAVLYKPIANKDQKTIENILKTAERFFRVIALIFVAYIIILSLFYPLIVSNDYSWLFTASLIIIIGFSTFAEYFFGMTYRIFLQAKQKTYIISIIQIITYILSIIAIVLLAKMGVGIHMIKLAGSLLFLIRPILQNIYVRKKYDISLKNCDGKYHLKQKWDGLAQHIAAVIHGKTDIVVLTIFSSLEEVSVYSVYYLVIKGIKSMIQSLAEGIDAAFGDMIAKKEKQNLNVKFSIYEVCFNTINTIIFTTTMLLATSFISVYTKGVTDANYIRPLFGYLIVISEYIWGIRLPYSSLTRAAGHFKETQIGAWVECITNIVLSVILVNSLGIVGVAIGTIVAMTIRTVEFVYHTNKYILERSVWESVKKILLVIAETIIIVLVSQMLPFRDNNNYLSWGINALMVFSVACMVTFALNYMFFHKELKASKKLLGRMMSKRRKN